MAKRNTSRNHRIALITTLAMLFAMVLIPMSQSVSAHEYTLPCAIDSEAHPNDRILFKAVDMTSTNVAYAWNFGDGYGSSEASPLHQYKQNGTYIVSLTITSSSGTLGRNTTSVSIGEVVVDSPSLLPDRLSGDVNLNDFLPLAIIGVLAIMAFVVARKIGDGKWNNDYAYLSLAVIFLLGILIAYPYLEGCL